MMQSSLGIILLLASMMYSVVVVEGFLTRHSHSPRLMTSSRISDQTTTSHQECHEGSRHSNYLAANEDEFSSRCLVSLKRDSFLSFLGGSFLSLSVVIPPALAFEGGVGGLGKTKPSTGVVLFNENSAPIQNGQGIISAEIESISGKPILVSFQTPWPLLATSGLEARDIRNPESSFVQVVPRVNNWQDKKVFQQLLIETVFAKAGKFSAYGEPYGFQIKPSL